MFLIIFMIFQGYQKILIQMKLKKHIINLLLSIILIKINLRQFYKEAEKIFIAIKDAYNNILLEKGLKKKTNFLNEKGEEIKNDYESIRPYPDQYDQSFAQFNEQWQNMDRKEFFEQMSEEEKQQYKESFDNIQDIKDYKLQIIDIKLKNPNDRFQIKHLKIQYGSNFSNVLIYLSLFITITTLVYFKKKLSCKILLRK